MMPVDAAVRELLCWIAERPRTYGETMDAWRSHCPRYTAWEDACLHGLVRVEDGGDDERVVLTDRGRAVISASS
jgi:hypothetical protein